MSRTISTSKIGPNYRCKSLEWMTRTDSRLLFLFLLVVVVIGGTTNSINILILASQFSVRMGKMSCVRGLYIFVCWYDGVDDEAFSFRSQRRDTDKCVMNNIIICYSYVYEMMNMVASVVVARIWLRRAHSTFYRLFLCALCVFALRLEPHMQCLNILQRILLILLHMHNDAKAIEVISIGK